MISELDVAGEIVHRERESFDAFDTSWRMEVVVSYNGNYIITAKLREKSGWLSVGEKWGTRKSVDEKELVEEAADDCTSRLVKKAKEKYEAEQTKFDITVELE